MAVTTTTSANGTYEAHEGTLQEVLDAVEADAPMGSSRFIIAVFHNGTSYVGVIRTG